jgi:hypothetical protein
MMAAPSLPVLFPGDVLLVRTGGLAATMIRFGAALRGHPNLSNHVAVVHHTDKEGTVWAIEGRPGGVGWADATTYLTSTWLLTNAAQPKTGAQRTIVAKTMETMIGTAYDWSAIVADAAADLRLDNAWLPTWHGTVPGHVVCSSVAAYAYGKASLTGPAADRTCTPADWDQWILTTGWAPRPVTTTNPV